ncbi:hypothetical protein [Arcticibacterium luteifluviistationis]|uniref:UspA domain-containing protein n=1 Tax=Arcticibacterium luteifluviistationis TaxID=1784714 RepID=A0A2Z4GCR7_9BACT|nr:hypothetical protein [Arcticibacterium luteifluviistationis]AWV98825.1 hypothetical protein DJ013_11840 [Arcticibacterium luteifluviistationis]
MSKNIKLALYTDFSEESRVTLNTVIFNTWGFHFDLDVLCILKDDNIQDALEKLEELKKELNFHLEDGHIIQTKVFLKDEEDLLINHINRESYFSLVVGVADSEINWKPGSTYHTLYTMVKTDLALVPITHPIKIENRGIVSLEFKNLEKLHALKKSLEFFKFYHAKIRLILLSDNLLSDNETETVMEFISNVLPELDIDLINVTKALCQESILMAVLESPIDYFLYFNDDHLENLVQNKLEAAIMPGIHKFSLIKMYVDEHILNDLKYGQVEMPKMRLKVLEEK